MNVARTLRRPWLWSLAVLLLVLAVLVAVFDWNWLRAPIERRVEAATGRAFGIGALDVDLGLAPRIRVRELHLGNAQWSRRKEEMLSLPALEFRIALLPLLRGRIDLPYVHLTRPQLLIERNREGRGNWQFQEPTSQRSERGRAPIVRELTIDDGRLQVHEPLLQTDLSLRVHSLRRPESEQRAPLQVSGTGSYRGNDFRLAARIDSPLDLRDSEQPFQVDLRASAGETRAHVSGATMAPLQLEDFDLQFALQGASLAALYPLVGIALPDSPPYRLQGRLGRHGMVWSYRDFQGRIGDSDVSGSLAIDLGRKRPHLQAELTSERLDFDDLAGWIGAPPSTEEGETASPAQQRAAQEREQSPHVLPDHAYDLQKLRTMDADVRLQAQHIDAPRLPLDRMNVHLQLKNGVLSLAPLDFAAAGGTIASTVELDARAASIVTRATADLKSLELPKLFPKVDMTKSGAGSISGTIALTAQGNSIAHMFGSANGEIGLVMSQGRISNLLLELAGLDVAESLKYLLDKNEVVPLRCAYAAFDVVDGIAKAQALAFDTTDTVLYGQGTLDLRNERIDLRLVPQPKDVSPVSLRGPLQIGGTFKDPSFVPKPAPLALRGAAAAALYAIAPPAALLALIETGPGQDVNCGPARRAEAEASR